MVLSACYKLPATKKTLLKNKSWAINRFFDDDDDDDGMRNTKTC